jgi:hypothetical protein
VAQQDLEYLGLKYNTPCLNYSWKNVLSFPKNWTIVFNMNGHTKGDGQFYTSEKALVNYTDIYIAKRKANWVKPEPKVKTGYLRRYAHLVTSASTGAVFKDLTEED